MLIKENFRECLIVLISIGIFFVLYKELFKKENKDDDKKILKQEDNKNNENHENFLINNENLNDDIIFLNKNIEKYTEEIKFMSNYFENVENADIFLS
jgi:hypothetical protein